jgi:hypothetical protein
MKPTILMAGMALAGILASAAVASPTSELAGRAAALRLAGAASPAELVRTTPAEDLAAAGPLTRVSVGANGVLLSAFLGQSLQRTVVTGDDGVVGWWNPIADAWLVSLWRRDSTGWRLRSVGAVVGDDLASAPVQGRPLTPRWIRSNASTAQALANQHREGAARFEAALRGGTLGALLNDPAGQQRAWTVVLGREGAMRRGLARLGGGAGLAATRHAMNEILVADAGAHVDPSSRAALAALPDPTRVTLRPVMALEARDGLAVLSASPLSPGVVIITHVAQGHPTRVETVALAATEARR